jgi:hypothetical protein
VLTAAVLAYYYYLFMMNLGILVVAPSNCRTQQPENMNRLFWAFLNYRAVEKINGAFDVVLWTFLNLSEEKGNPFVPCLHARLSLRKEKSKKHFIF